MKRTGALLALCLWLSGCALPSSNRPAPKFFAPVTVAPGIEMDSATFGMGDRDNSGAYYVRENAVIPLNPPGTPYGWQIHLITSKTVVKFREEFTLPVAPGRWGDTGSDPAGVSTDRKTCVTERTEPLDGGWLHNGWSVAPGDPAGTYTMKIYIEDQLAKEFTFKVQ